MAFELSGPADETLLRDALRQVMERNTAFFMIVSDGISERIFYFAIGGIRVIGSGTRRSLTVGEALVARGDVDLDTFNRVMDIVKHDDRRFAEAVVQYGLLEPEKLQAALEAQVEEEILDLFFWDGAELVFTEGLPPKSFYEGRFQTAHLSCDVAKLLGGVLERVDVWRDTVQRLPNGREVFEVTEKGLAQQPGRWARLLGLLDGTRTAGDAIERSGSSRVAGFEYLMLALRDGRVRRTVGSAAQRVTRDQLLRDIELLEAALKGRVDTGIVRTRLARTLEQAGEAARAAAQWRALGDQARRVNELDRALRHYGEAVRVLPTDFATRELILEIHRHRQDWAQVIAHGRPLADLFLKHNLLNRAKHLLLQLVGLEPQDASLRRTLIFVLMGLGERELALRHLRELAKLLEARGAGPTELRDVYIRILALDPRDKPARKRFEQISGIASQRRAVRLTIGAAAAVLAAIGVWYTVENDARRTVNRAVETARQQVLDRDLDGAKRTLETASAEVRFSRAGRNVDGFLREIERMQRDQTDRQERRKAAMEASGVGDFAALRDERAASQMVRDAQKLLSEGRNADAHRVLTEAIRLHPETNAAREVRFPLHLKVLPRDARVLVNGVERPAGIDVLELQPSAKTVLQVEAPGYAPFREVLEGVQPAERVIHLHRPLRWTHGLAAGCEAAPLVTATSVVVAGRDRFVTALAAADGAPLWRVPLGLYGDVAVSPVAVDDLVIVATAQGDVVAIAAQTGEVRWRVALGQPVDVQPLAAPGVALVPLRDGSIQAIGADGQVRWQLPAKSLAPGAAPALLDDAHAAWVDGRGLYRAVAVADGAVVPRAPTNAVLRGTPRFASDDRMWVFAEDESLRLVAASSGALLRRFPMPRAHVEAPPTVVGEIAWATGHDGSIAAFRANGETVFRRRLDDPVSASPAVDGDLLLVPGARGRVTAADAQTGDVLWSFDARGRVTARPVVAHGMIVVVTAHGAVHCLER